MLCEENRELPLLPFCSAPPIASTPAPPCMYLCPAGTTVRPLNNAGSQAGSKCAAARLSIR
eukprot:9004664-Prorocentrum_lima.AAC.1